MLKDFVCIFWQTLLLGIRAYGVHINGYVTLPNGEIELWVAKRAANKQTFPGKLDHLVVG